MVRDEVTAALSGAILLGNNVLRVMSDAMAGLCHLVLRYIDWLSKQLMPDTAETEWLDRHADIWLVNADGSIGRKVATLSTGTVEMTAVEVTVIPIGHQMSYIGGQVYEVVAQTTMEANEPTPVPVRALDPGVAGNLPPGTELSIDPLPDVSSSAVVIELRGGTETENDIDLRARVLERIQQPPMGGDQEDYVHWALMVPGVTRAWCYPLEMGIGTVTVRFMMDELRAEENDGFPLQEDINAVTDFLNHHRPVTVKDFFVVAPIRFPINLKIINLTIDDTATRAAIEESIKEMFYIRAKPGQEIYRSWISEAISLTVNVDHFDLEYENTEMPSNGYMPIVGTISYG